MERIDQSRRQFLKGQGARPAERYLISSAVVSAFPERADEVARTLGTLPDTEVRTEVRAVQGGKIVIILEGQESGAIGARLAEIALMDGVLAASLVYEHAEILSDGADDGSHAA
jgi:nitrate reductase NapD